MKKEDLLPQITYEELARLYMLDPNLLDDLARSVRELDFEINGLAETREIAATSDLDWRENIENWQAAIRNARARVDTRCRRIHHLLTENIMARRDA